MSNPLQQIQQLQFTDRGAAEAILLEFFQHTLALDAAVVELRPLAVSLNSFNGFLTQADGKRLFFKTHTEQDTVIAEYYNAAMLAEAGYPVIQPIYSSTQTGRQLLIYDVINDPSVFDVAWAIENGQSDALEALTTAQHDADDRLWQIYQQTLTWQSAENHTRAPIHQLFYHRLTGGRLDRFYGAGQSVLLPTGREGMAVVRAARWTINGRDFAETLDDLIARATLLLAPDQAGPAVIGHGDAHNGNVFFVGSDRLVYFDPAFAGRHHPLLDLVKPLFHNVFAMWMYFPAEMRDRLNVHAEKNGGRWSITYDDPLHPIREMFLRSKALRVLLPTLRLLRERDWLADEWRPMLKAALFCCPFLTMNLTDSARFLPDISAVGLAMSIEMGAESPSGNRTPIDCLLDEVEAAI
jgi:hypothetical protein